MRAGAKGERSWEDRGGEEEGEAEEEGGWRGWKRQQERVLMMPFDHWSPWMKLCLNHT